MFRNLLKNFSYKGKNSKEDFISAVLITALYFVLLSLFFLFCPESLFEYTSSTCLVILYFVSAAVLFLFTTSIGKLFKKNEINIFAAIIIKIFHVILCLLAGLILTLLLRYGCLNLKNSLSEKKIENAKIEKQSEEKNIQNESEQKTEESENKVLKVNDISGFMKISSENAPVYLIPAGIRNPFDSEELTANISDGEEEAVFEDLHVQNLEKGTVVKPLFKKTAPDGNEWILVYLNSSIKKQADFVFIEAKNLESESSVTDKKYFENEKYMLKDWNSYVTQQAEYYSKLWD